MHGERMCVYGRGGVCVHGEREDVYIWKGWSVRARGEGYTHILCACTGRCVFMEGGECVCPGRGRHGQGEEPLPYAHTLPLPCTHTPPLP